MVLFSDISLYTFPFDKQNNFEISHIDNFATNLHIIIYEAKWWWNKGRKIVLHQFSKWKKICHIWKSKFKILSYFFVFVLCIWAWTPTSGTQEKSSTISTIKQVLTVSPDEFNISWENFYVVNIFLYEWCMSFIHVCVYRPKNKMLLNIHKEKKNVLKYTFC